MLATNNTETDPERHFQRLKAVAAICPTWIQTCMFALDGRPPEETEVEAWLDMLARARAERLPLQGVLLYGLARPSLQAEADRLEPLPEIWLHKLASRGRSHWLDCSGKRLIRPFLPLISPSIPCFMQGRSIVGHRSSNIRTCASG